MKLNIFKPIFFLAALLVISKTGFAQDTLAITDTVSKGFIKSIEVTDVKQLELTMNELNKSLNNNLKFLDKDFNIDIPEITVSIKDIGESFSVNLNTSDVGMGITSSTVEDKIKTYSKTYSVDANDKLDISNKYGKVVVNTWNKNEFKIDVQIKGYANDDQTAQKMIDATSISDSKDGNVVSFKTNFGNTNGSLWKLFNNMSNNHRIEVNYTIYMPSKNALAIDNRYGATELPDFEGKVEINSAYGSVSAKALTHTGNEIKVRYGSANIERLSTSNLNVGYGSLELGTVDKLSADISYSSAKIGKIKNSAKIDARYAGNIEIDDLDKNFTNFSANGSYSGFTIGLSNLTHADFDVTVHYGSFDYGSLPFTIIKKTPADSEKGFHSTQTYKGHVGKGNPERTINIKSNYSNIKFN